jgi:phosphatidate cytidylyltransferase
MDPASAKAGRPAGAALPESTPVLVRTGIGAALFAAVGLLAVLDSAWDAGFVYAAVGVAVIALAMGEFWRLARLSPAPVSKHVLVLGGTAVFLAQWAAWALPGLVDPWLAGPAVACLIIMVLFSGRVLRAQIDGALQAVSVTAAGLLYIPGLLGFLTAIRAEFGVAGLLTALAVCKGGSTGAYFAGKGLGRTRLAPRVSPGKTVAGAVGAILASAAIAYAMSGQPWSAVSRDVAIPYGVTAGVAAIFGDLAASLLKREAGVKDSGRLLPGVGGMLDMVDDLLFVAPVSFLFFLGCGHPPAGA